MLIVDIDNTIISQDFRKKSILSDIFKEEIEIVEGDFDLTKTFLKYQHIKNISDERIKELKREFEKIFFGSGYYEKRISDIIDNSNEVLQTIKNKVQIYYVTSRFETLRKITCEQLKDLGFPEVDNTRNCLFMMPDLKVSLSDFPQASLKFKNEVLKELALKHEIIAGIGDTPEDMICFNSNNIMAILYSNYYFQSDIELVFEKESITFDPYGIIEFSSWKEINLYLSMLISTESSPLMDRVKNDSNTYSKWMSDLDNKAYLLLIVSTACTTLIIFLLNIDRIKASWLVYPVLLSSVLAVLSIILSIRAFGSKNTSSKSASIGLNIRNSIGSPKNIFKCLLGREIKPLGPITDHYNVHSSRYSKNAYIKFYKDRYGTIEPTEIESLKLFEIRAANYAKIYPEILARTFLIIALLLLIFAIVMAYSPISKMKVNTLVNPKGNFFVAKPIQIDDSDFDSNTLNEKGLEKIQAAYKSQKLINNDCIIIRFEHKETMENDQRSQLALVSLVLYQIDPTFKIQILDD